MPQRNLKFSTTRGPRDGRFAQVRHEDNLTQLQRGQYTGTVTSQMCKDLASRIDATGLNVDLSKAGA